MEMRRFGWVIHPMYLVAVGLLFVACGVGPVDEPPQNGPPDTPGPGSAQEVELAVVEELEEFGEARAARLDDGALTVTIWEGESTIAPDEVDHIQSVAEGVAGAQADRVEVIISDEDPHTED